jgi:hypothetical protein
MNIMQLFIPQTLKKEQSCPLDPAALYFLPAGWGPEK